MGENWNDSTCLGLVPHFHADPALNGPPQASPDGHWWWDGTAWTAVGAAQEARQPAPV
jgi:hypothetical protein